MSMGEKSGFDSVTGDVVQAAKRNDGSEQWQAELLFSLGEALGGSGRPRTMTIRGPYRTDKDKVKDDLDSLLEASNQGMRAVRTLATSLKLSRIS